MEVDGGGEGGGPVFSASSSRALIVLIQRGEGVEKITQLERKMSNEEKYVALVTGCVFHRV